MSDFLYKDETHRIIGCCMEVHNAIGHGLHEKIFENSLVVEFGDQQIPVEQQPHYPVIYKSVEVGKYIPDLICFEQIILDTKTIKEITDRVIGKMLNYLRITKLKVGLIVNFKKPKLEWKRVVL